MIKYFVILEPHADDAFISTGGHIEQWIKEGKKVFISTVAPQEPKRIAEAESYAKAVGATHIKLGSELDALLRNPDAQCLLPVGIQHPEHIETTEKYLRRCCNVWRYLDQPYAVKIKNVVEINSKIEGATIVSYLKPSARKWRHIPIFKTQEKFFYFEGENCKRSFELILKFRK